MIDQCVPSECPQHASCRQAWPELSGHKHCRAGLLLYSLQVVANRLEMSGSQICMCFLPVAQIGVFQVVHFGYSGTSLAHSYADLKCSNMHNVILIKKKLKITTAKSNPM